MSTFKTGCDSQGLHALWLCFHAEKNTASNMNVGMMVGGVMDELVLQWGDAWKKKLTLPFIKLTVISDEKEMKTFIDSLFIKHRR